jgi:hypothetical protein
MESTLEVTVTVETSVSVEMAILGSAQGRYEQLVLEHL